MQGVNLLILVGVTGVGKSTLVDRLADNGLAFTRLPDRRFLTDALIIRTIQVADGLPPAEVTDRRERFDYTRRFRGRYPGGMAAALAQLWVRTESSTDLFVFDGLRGTNEIEYAAQAMPLARFVMLHAPDAVRVQRLLGRGDTFDHVGDQPAATSPGGTAGFAQLGVPEASALLTPADEAMFLGWVARGEVTASDLSAKLRIVVEERRSYDPVATHAALIDHAKPRALVVDTVSNAPDDVAALLAGWLQTQWPRDAQ